MTTGRLGGLADGALPARWIETGLKQGAALAAGDVAGHNRLSPALRRIEQELARRGRLGLLAPALDHANPQVRLNAARALAASEPAAARRTLKALAASGVAPQAAAAAMDLWMLGKSDPKPDGPDRSD